VTWRSRTHQVLEGHHEAIGTIVRWFLAILIVANVFAVIVETVPDVQRDWGQLILDFETFSLIVFGAEYVLRMWSAAEHAHFQGLVGRLRWAITPGAIIDLLAIAPAMIFPEMRLVRLLRIARLVRIAKLGRYSLALRTLRRVMVARMPDLVGLTFVLSIILVLSSALMFHFEHDAQPEQFSSIPATLWWGIITLTTIGYGDMAPLTMEGRILGSIVAVIGIGMFALPAGLLGGAFVEELGKARRAARDQRATGVSQTMTHCPHCKKPLATD
tara:strand:- start:758 stop:1573 length:816 start_codon:yes stop_codon:yes gene_type:complete